MSVNHGATPRYLAVDVLGIGLRFSDLPYLWAFNCLYPFFLVGGNRDLGGAFYAGACIGSQSVCFHNETKPTTPMDNVQQSDPMEGVAIAADTPEVSTSAPKVSQNPFAEGAFNHARNSHDLDQVDPAQNFPYTPTEIPQNALRKCVFKTSNRIFDDMRFTPAFFEARANREISSDITSLLRSRPIEYKTLIPASLVSKKPLCLISNNTASQAMPLTRKEYANYAMVVTTIRGLIVSQNCDRVCHFKVKFLDDLKKRSSTSIGKHQFHLIERESVSVDDLKLLDDSSVASDNLLDDAIYKTLNDSMDQIMRVSVYSSEFTPEDLSALTDQGIIKARYMKSLECSPLQSLSPDAIPGPLQCYQTLLKVLKGPIMLAPDEAIHTIKRSKTSLDARLDIDLLFNRLSFTLGSDSDILVPPNLSINSALKESYIRKSNEIIYLGKSLKVNQKNEFDITYSFNDNLSQIHVALAEFDKNASLTLARNDDTNKLPDYISLSCYTFGLDELIIWCYEQTVNSDPSNKGIYVDSFKEILALRLYGSSNRLRSYYNNQMSRGLMYGLSDYRNSLKEIGIEGVPDEVDIDEQAIIEMYKASCKSNPKNYCYFNKHLTAIATIRNSNHIKNFLQTEIIPQSIALEELRIEDVTEDEVAVTAYEFRLDELMQSVNFNLQSPEIKMLQKCMLSIAVFRKSYILLTYVDNNMPELLQTKSRSLSECYQIFDCDINTSDFDLISKFQTLMAQSSQDDEVNVRDLRSCFKNIATGRQSGILFSFLLDGKVDASLLPAENWPAGLDNIGNTCYLNSLLQYYFSIKPLRDTILGFDECEIDRSRLLTRKIGGRFVESSEVDRSIQFIYRLQELFNEMVTTNRRFVQPSKELVYLSFLPLSQPVTFQEQAIDSKMGETILVPDDVEMKLEENLIDMDSPQDFQSQETASDALDNATKERQTKIMSIGQDQIESAIEIGRQQDVTECIDNVTFQIETALEPERMEDDGEQYDLIKQLFCGKTKQTILPLEGNGPPRITTERFFSLIINVGDHPRNIYDTLDNYFGENKVNLGSEMVKMSLTILEVPEILQFQVQRVLFDREKLMAYKSLEVIPFGESIYLDRYLSTEDPEILAKRQEVFEWKTEIKALEEEKNSLLEVDATTKISIVDTLAATARYLRTKVLTSNVLSIKQETIEALETQVAEMKHRLQTIEDQIKALQQSISDQFASYQKVGYSLFAVFIHRGEASYGHYWVYIKDLKRNLYRKYNDDTVTEVPASEIFNFTETNTATPYYMVYVKESLQESYIDPLKREIRG